MARWTRRIGAAFAGVAMISLAAAGQAPKPADPATPSDLRSPQEQNADLFRKFQRELLFLAQRLEKSDQPGDQERAKVITAALELAKQEGVETQFQKMIAGLAKGGTNLQHLDGIAGQDKQLQKALQDILTVLMTDDSATQIKTERERMEKLLAETREILRQQKTVRGMTEAKRVDPDRIAKDQGNVTERTKDLAKKMAGDPKAGGKDGKAGEKELAKSEPKSEAKPGEAAGDDKPETPDAKSEPKAGPDDAADAPGKPSAGEPKLGDGKPDAKAGESKDPPAGKEGDQPKPGEPRGAGEPKDGQPKAGSPKEGTPKDGSPKPGTPEDGSPKSGETKAGDAKADPKGESKGPGEGKAQAKPSEGQPGGDGKPMKPKGDQQSAQAPPSAPKPGGSPPPDGGEPGSPPPPGGQQAQQPDQPGRKQVQSAIPHQKGSQKDLEAKKRDTAGKQQDKAIEELAKAAEELEKRIKQLREQEQLGLLANLEARCGLMLSLQIEVYEATKAIDGVVLKNNGAKSNSEIQKSQEQADKELKIVGVADAALKLLESEGSAVAFARVLEEVRVDMAAIQRRLNDTYVGKDTQGIEENVIAMLKEMVQALKKAQEDIKQQQGQPPPPPGSPPKPGDKNLIELVSELKLIRSLQVQVNGRTKGSAESYKGEQAADPIVRAELQQLAERQAKLQEMLTNIATGRNK